MAKQKTTQKTLNFVLQSKGGVGKSFLIWLAANKYKDNENVIFIDLDNSTKTTNQRLANVVGEDRVSHYSILDDQKKIEREAFLNMLAEFSEVDFEQMFVDFGAPESEEFLKFLQYELTVETLKDACKELNVEIRFYIVVAGNDTLNACLNYSMPISKILHNNFEIYWYLNLGLSGGIDTRATTTTAIETALQKEEINAKLITFGDLGFSQSAKDIVQMLSSNSSPTSLPFASKLKFNQVLNDFSKKISHD